MVRGARKVAPSRSLDQCQDLIIISRPTRHTPQVHDHLRPIFRSRFLSHEPHYIPSQELELPKQAFITPLLEHSTKKNNKNEMASKPTVLIVHGAWHEPQPAYEPLKLQIESLGYECYMPKLPTAGGDEVRGVTWEADVQAILEVALPLFDQGKEVVLVAHSYGGVPSCIATRGLGVQERAAKGKSGGFRQIIFIAAFAIPAKGMDVLATFGGKWPGWADFAEPYTKVGRPHPHLTQAPPAQVCNIEYIVNHKPSLPRYTDRRSRTTRSSWARRPRTRYTAA